MGRYTSGGVGRDMLAGAVAGAAAIWVANKLDRAIYRSGSAASVRKSEAARPGGMDPAHVLAKRAADAVGVEVENPGDNPAGHTIHYGIAAGIGALYGLLRGMSPAVSTGRGAMFGIALFILKDEIGNTALGTAGNPLNYPLRDHVRGAATSTLFGIVTDFSLRLISPWRDEVVVLQGPPLSERLDRGRAYLDQTRSHVYERGREGLDRGRNYLDQGVNYANQLVEQGRSHFPRTEFAGYAGRYAGQIAANVRSRLPDYAEAAGLARAGKSRASEVAQASYRRAGRFADSARAHVPETPTTGISRAFQRLFG